MRKNIFWPASIVILLSVLLVTCSSDQTDQAAPTPRPLQPVSLQLQWVIQAQFAGYYVALDKGWYREEGIDLTIKPGGPDLVPIDLVASGTSDFGTTLLADSTVAIQKGKPVISIAQIQQTNGLLLIAHKSSGITRPKDVIGKRVGVWLGSWEAQFNALLVKEGIASRDVEVVSQGWSMEPFLKGELDVASAMIYNEYHVVLENGIKPEELNIINYADYGLGFPGDVLLTTRQMTEQHPDLCVRMLRASLKGWQYAIDHPEEAADIVLKYDQSGVQTRQHQLSMMKEISRLIQTTERPLGYPDQAIIQHMIDTLWHYGILSEPVQRQDVYTTEFLDQLQK